MITLFIILIILASVFLGAIVLIQNPKGGGLSGNIAGFSNQFMGVKQTTDVLEKGTWILAGSLVILCLISTLVIKTGKGVSTETIKNIPTTGTSTNQATPSIPAQPANPTPAK